jgi:hypothetical protein
MPVCAALQDPSPRMGGFKAAIPAILACFPRRFPSQLAVQSLRRPLSG